MAEMDNNHLTVAEDSLNINDGCQNNENNDNEQDNVDKLSNNNVNDREVEEVESSPTSDTVLVVPAIPKVPKMVKAYVLAVDVGTTRLRCHVCDVKGNIKGEASCKVWLQITSHQ